MNFNKVIILQLDVWPPFYNTKSIKNAEKVLEMLQAEGATNIQAALEVALKLIQKNKNDKNQPMIVFLTDGEVTQGESDVNKIIAKVYLKRLLIIKLLIC